MKGVNKAILVGNLGRAPQTTKTESGVTVTVLSVATNEKWKDKGSGEWRDRVEWHRVVCFGRMGEVARDYCKRGGAVYVEGVNRSRQYEESGVQHWIHEIHALDLVLLSGHESSNGKGQGDDKQKHESGLHRAPQPPDGGVGITDEDIPF